MRRHGRASVRASSPKAFSICDRCGFLYNRRDLGFQHEYRGVGTRNTRILVCDTCRDTPQQQLRSIRLKQDPVPTQNPRPLIVLTDFTILPGTGAATWQGYAPTTHVIFTDDITWTTTQNIAWGGGSTGTAFDITWGPQT